MSEKEWFRVNGAKSVQLAGVEREFAKQAKEQRALKRRIDALEGAARDVVRWREGDLPSLGYLRDNDKSREALARLTALVEGRR